MSLFTVWTRHCSSAPHIINYLILTIIPWGQNCYLNSTLDYTETSGQITCPRSCTHNSRARTGIQVSLQITRLDHTSILLSYNLTWLMTKFKILILYKFAFLFLKYLALPKANSCDRYLLSCHMLNMRYIKNIYMTKLNNIQYYVKHRPLYCPLVETCKYFFKIILFWIRTHTVTTNNNTYRVTTQNCNLYYPLLHSFSRTYWFCFNVQQLCFMTDNYLITKNKSQLIKIKTNTCYIHLMI